jgi:hypothetical protein
MRNPQLEKGAGGVKIEEGVVLPGKAPAAVSWFLKLIIGNHLWKPQFPCL